MANVPLWGVYETTFGSTGEYPNPFWDVVLTVDFYAPSGSKASVEAFWDGEHVWRVRFSPTEEGEWRWVSRCSIPQDFGLHAQTGCFVCEGEQSDSPLVQHGPLRLSSNNRCLTHHDKTPFFWLADTAWNGVLRASNEDWQKYLDKRREQGFTVVQFVCTHWRGHTQDAQGERAWDGEVLPVLNPAFFQRMDARVTAINNSGLVASPVIFWAATDLDPGQTLGEEAARRLARYIVARWGAHQVVWMLAGDGNYSEGNSQQWIAMGREVFAHRSDRLVTLHNCHQKWPDEAFQREAWYSFVGYQSGHERAPDNLRWLVDGPPSMSWRHEPPRLAINLEPNYEGHPIWGTDEVFSAFHVRRAAYWSMLIGPPAGVSYGNNSIWVWATDVEDAENHENLRDIAPWSQGVETEGVRCMSLLRMFFEELRWWEFAPAQELLLNQPGSTVPELFIAASMRSDGAQAVIYSPAGEDISLTSAAVNTMHGARWFDPRTGVFTQATPSDASPALYTPPDKHDWLLVLGE